MKRIQIWLKNFLLEPLKASYTRFPLALIYSFLLGIIMVLNEGLELAILTNVSQSLFLFLPVAISLVLARETFSFWRWSMWIDLIFLVLATIGFFVYIELETRLGVEFSRFSNLGFGFYLLPLFLGYYQEKKAIEVPITIGISKFFTALFYSLVLFLGIAVILVSINVLFNLSISLTTYSNTFILVMTFVFVPTWLGSMLPAEKASYEGKDFPAIWKRLFLFVVTPVVSVFMVFIVIYLLTGLFQSDTYNAGIYTFSTLVIGFAGISAHVSTRSFQAQYPLVKFFQSFFPIVLLIIVVGYYLELIRLGLAFGFSISVMLQLVMGIWLVSYAVFSLKKQTEAPQKGLLVLVTIYVLAAILPFGNVVGLSRLALNVQYQQTLERLDMLDENGEIIPNNALSNSDYERLYSLLTSMDTIGFTHFENVPEAYEHPNDFSQTFGTRESDPLDSDTHDYVFLLQQNVLDLTSFDYNTLLYISSVNALEDNPYNEDNLSLSFISDEDAFTYTLTIGVGDAEQSIELYEEVVLALRDRVSNDEPNILDYETTDPTVMKFVFSTDAFVVELWVLSAISFRGYYANFSMSMYLGILLP